MPKIKQTNKALCMHVTSLHRAVVDLSSDDDAAALSDSNADFSCILHPPGPGIVPGNAAAKLVSCQQAAVCSHLEKVQLVRSPSWNMKLSLGPS